MSAAKPKISSSEKAIRTWDVTDLTIFSLLREGKNTNEIATLLGMTASAVSQRLSAINDRLPRKLLTMRIQGRICLTTAGLEVADEAIKFLDSIRQITSKGKKNEDNTLRHGGNVDGGTDLASDIPT